jgi:hypothetical protein
MILRNDRLAYDFKVTMLVDFTFRIWHLSRVFNVRTAQSSSDLVLTGTFNNNLNFITNPMEFLLDKHGYTALELFGDTTLTLNASLEIHRVLLLSLIVLFLAFLYHLILLYTSHVINSLPILL